MPSAREIYEAWEQSPPSTVMHLMAIFRGDGADANVLTLTDKPYVDKGVGGVRYHHSRPAPIQCIVSEIVTIEKMGSTSYRDIELANGEGRLNGLLTDEEIVGKPFIMYRGDQNWSMMEVDLPYRFEEIFIGQIDAVEYTGDGSSITLKIVPKRYNMDVSVATPDEPLLIGPARNVPLTLVDDATHQYRFNATFPQTQISGSVDIKDNGVVLTEGASPDDWEKVSESGLFKGLVQLDAAPSGKLTASVKSGVQSTGDGQPAVFLQFFVDTGYTSFIADFSDTVPTAYTLADMVLASDLNKLYYRRDDYLPQIVVQNTYTGTDLLGSTYDSKYLDLTTVFGGSAGDYVRIDISPDGNYLFALNTSGVLKRSTLGTAGDISTAGSSDQSLDVAAMASPYTINHFRLIGDRLYYSTSAGKIIGADLAGNWDISSASATSETSLTFKSYSPRSTYVFDISADKRCLVIASDPELTFGRTKVHQLRLAEADDLSTVYYDDRCYDLSSLNSYQSIQLHADMTCLRFFDDDDLLFFSGYNRDVQNYVFTVTDKLLPRDIFAYRPAITDTEVLSYCSVFYNSEARAGEVLRRVISPAADDYQINRFGKFVSVRVRDPSDYSTAHFTVRQGDLLGERGSWIRILQQTPKQGRVTLKYAPNYAVQSQAETAGSVSQELKENYAREWYYLEQDVTGAPAFAPTIIKELYFYDRDTVNEYFSDPPDDRMATEVAVAEEVRTLFEINCRLAVTPHLDGPLIELGAMGKMDFDGAFFARESLAQLHGVEKNYTRNRQLLELFI